MCACISYYSGSPAFVGFQDGSKSFRFSLPGSESEQVLFLSNTSNVQVPGVWVYRIDDSASIESGGVLVYMNSWNIAVLPLSYSNIPR